MVMSKIGHKKSWLKKVADTFSSWKFGFTELIVVVVLLIIIIVVIHLYETFCDSHVDPNVELEPTELEMRELPRPFVDFPLIDYVRLNQRELEHIVKEEETFSTASTIPLEKCVIITENIIRRASQGSIWQEYEEDDEDEEEEHDFRDTTRVIVYPDRVEWSIHPILNTDDVTSNDEESDLVTEDIDESETIAIATNPSESNIIPIEDDNPSEIVVIPIEDGNPSEIVVIPIEDGNPSEIVVIPIEDGNPSEIVVNPIEDDNPSEIVVISIEDNDPSESIVIPIEDDNLSDCIAN